MVGGARRVSVIRARARRARADRSAPPNTALEATGGIGPIVHEVGGAARASTLAVGQQRTPHIQETGASVDERTTHLTSLPTRLMDVLLAGDDPMLAALRRHYRHATIADYRFTGVGFFLGFTLPHTIVPVHPSNFDIRDVWIEWACEGSNAMAILAIRNGLLTYLEAVTIEGDWPHDAQRPRLRYSTRSAGASSMERTSARDMDRVRAYWT